MFCSTCLNRGQQALLMLLVNIVILFPFRAHIKWALTLYGMADGEIFQSLAEWLVPAISIGLLKIASGGITGRNARKDGHAGNRIGGMPDEPDESAEAVPVGLPGSEPKTMMRFWHASIAKNGAHQFGMHAFGNFSDWEDLWLCSLDCDNITPPSYLQEVATLMHQGRDIPFWCIRISGSHQKGLTGRYVYRAKDFVALNGYEERLRPTGSQDIDLRDRFVDAAHAKSPTVKKCELYGQATQTTSGFDLPNDFAMGKKTDRGEAKVRNIDPKILEATGQQPAGQWKALNDESFKLTQQLRRGDGVANVDGQSEQERSIGPWLVELNLYKMIKLQKERQGDLSNVGPIDHLELGSWIVALWNETVTAWTLGSPVVETKPAAQPAIAAPVPDPPRPKTQVRIVVTGLCELKWLVNPNFAEDAYQLGCKLARVVLD